MTKPKADGGNRGGKGIPQKTVPNPNLIPKEEYWAWQNEAKCADQSVEMFFLPYAVRGETKRKAEAQAKAVCKGCPVISECLAHALRVPEEFGVWGGLSPEERRVVSRKLELNNKLNIKTTTDTIKD